MKLARLLILFVRRYQLGIDAFDHAVTLWIEGDPAYLGAMQQHSERWVLQPVSPRLNLYRAASAGDMS